MAHQVETMFSTKNQVPWHGLGTVLNADVITAEDAIKHANIAWKVRKDPIYHKVGDSFIEVKDNFSIVREDKNIALGVVGSRYEPVQNTDLFSFFDPIVEREEAIYETGGILKEGKVVWLLAKLPDYLSINNSKEDLLKKYILLIASHDGTKPVIAKITPIRVVCNNTLTAALKDKQSEVRIRHTKSANEKLQEAHRILAITNDYHVELQQIFNEMANTKINTKKFDSYLESVFKVDDSKDISTRTQNQILSVKELFEVGAGSKLSTAKGTLWGAYNAVTEYADHYKLKNYEADSRADNIWFGSSASLKQNAFERALEIVNN